MKYCKKCNKEIDKNSAKNYCSRSCANSRTWTSIDKEKKRQAAYKRLQRGKWGRMLIDTHTPEIIAKQKETKLKKLMSTPFNTLSWDSKRKVVIIEQNNTCNRCNLNQWLNHPIVLEVDHKDGNNTNNTRENLEALCPNCHSLTDTWRGRNQKRKTVPYSNKDLTEAYSKCKNISQALKYLGLAPKGGNYQRMKNAILNETFKMVPHEGTDPSSRS